MEDFARFQDSQNTRKAYLAEAAELAYLGRSGGEWGLGLTELARDQIVNAVGYRLIPLYRLIGPTAVIVILVMFIVGMARMLIDILVRAIIIARVRGWGFWMFGPCGTRPSRWRSLRSGGQWRKARKVPAGSGIRWRPELPMCPVSPRRMGQAT